MNMKSDSDSICRTVTTYLHFSYFYQACFCPNSSVFEDARLGFAKALAIKSEYGYWENRFGKEQARLYVLLWILLHIEDAGIANWGGQNAVALVREKITGIFRLRGGESRRGVEAIQELQNFFQINGIQLSSSAEIFYFAMLCRYVDDEAGAAKNEPLPCEREHVGAVGV